MTSFPRVPFIPWNRDRGKSFLQGGSTHEQRENDMPAKSKQQQKAAGAALSAKRGETPRSRLRGASKQMVESMSEDELERMASVKRKTLPRRATAKSTKAKGSRPTSSRTRSRRKTAKRARK